MTESEWLSSRDPRAMVEFLTAPGVKPVLARKLLANMDRPPSDRKLRLFASAIEPMLGGRGYDEVTNWRHEIEVFLQPEIVLAVNEPSRQADLLRETFGNPFRPVPKCSLSCVDPEEGYHAEDCDLGRWLRRNGGTVLHLAKEIYGGGEEACGQCNGEDIWIEPKLRKMFCSSCKGTGKITRPFNPTLMPMLADALEDAGCRDVEILNHLRGMKRCTKCLGAGECKRTRPTGSWSAEWFFGRCDLCGGGGWITSDAPHVRGCWVIDLLLGYE